jgi:hypothetical protein
VRTLTAAALGAALLLAPAALADHHEVTMAGVYQTPDGGITMTFGADGQMDGLSPTGVHVRDTFTIENGVYTVTGAESHPVCPGAVGVYELSQSEDGVITMTLVSEECELRGQGLNGAQWIKMEE